MKQQHISKRPWQRTDNMVEQRGTKLSQWMSSYFQASESYCPCSLFLTVCQLNTGCQGSMWDTAILLAAALAEPVLHHTLSAVPWKQPVFSQKSCQERDENLFPTLLGASIMEKPEGSFFAREREQLKLFPHFRKLKSHQVFPAQLSLK